MHSESPFQLLTGQKLIFERESLHSLSWLLDDKQVSAAVKDPLRAIAATVHE